VPFGVDPVRVYHVPARRVHESEEDNRRQVLTMVKFFDYIWKHDGPLLVKERSVRFEMKPLEKDAVFADLRDGRAFRVSAVSKGTKKLGTFRQVPKDIVHTFDAKPLSDEELAQLRTRCKFDEDDEWKYLILS
jgi:hypothetical protein